MTLTAGTVFGGRWVIERPLSSGGMGAVYVAKHRETGRPVALKVIKAETGVSDELVARFRKETGALAAISHPNVVTFLDSGVEDGTLFLVMELLAGRPLRAIMHAPVEPARALRIAADLCRALAAVHAQGIVHRDLKPENVFLVDAVGHDEIAKLIDFGIVRLEDAAGGATATATGAVVGTPGYISPEQLQGRPATEASDVYAVGVILYELVTGHFPFNAPSTHAMLVKQLIEPLPPPRSVLPSLPVHIEALVLHFMQRDPAARVRSAREALGILVAAAQAPASLPPSAATEAAMPMASSPARAEPATFFAEVPARATAATPHSTQHAAPHAAPVPTPAPARTRTALVAGVSAAAAVVVVAVVAAVATSRSDPAPPPAADGGTPTHITAPAVAPAAEERVGDEGARTPSAGTAASTPAASPGSPSGASSSARFVGSYDGSFAGTAVVDGASTRESGASRVRITHAPLGRLALQFVDANGRAPCTTMLAVHGDRATFAPATQECSLPLRGGRRTNRSSGSISLLPSGALVLEVNGSFEFVSDVGAAARGTFEHHWTLRRAH